MEQTMISLIQIRNRLIEAIKQSSLTQKELAEKLQVSQSCVSHYVRGTKMPSLDTFANLCKILDVDPAYILCVD